MSKHKDNPFIGWEIEDISDELADERHALGGGEPRVLQLDAALEAAMKDPDTTKAEMKRAYNRLHRQRAALDAQMKRLQKGIDRKARAEAKGAL